MALDPWVILVVVPDQRLRMIRLIFRSINDRLDGGKYLYSIKCRDWPPFQGRTFNHSQVCLILESKYTDTFYLATL